MSSVTTSGTRKQAPKQPRTATLGTLNNGKLILCITQGDDVRSYLLTPIASDFGTAYHLLKGDNGDGSREEYDVCLNGNRSTCECKGFIRWHHCKHVESLTALTAAGKLPTAKPAEAKPEAKPAVKQPWCEHCNDNREVYCSHCSL